MRTRFAPTPSGFLHAGNLTNALLTSWLAQELGGELLLRIDADDSTRVRPEYVAYIYASLAALNLSFSDIPSSHMNRREYLRSQIALLPQDHVFACSCSRSDLLDRPCACKGQNLAWVAGKSALRLHLGQELSVYVNGESFTLNEHFGDVVLWRRDDLPAYHWANVIDDRDLGITHIVRGQDLASSSALHIYLARLIGADNVATCQYLHHQLVLDSQGRKISKSTQSNASAPDLTYAYLANIRDNAAILARDVGIAPVLT